MSTPARSPRPTSPASNLELVPDNEKASFFDQFYGLVSERAYSLFEESGGFHGDDVTHWLQAERELAALPDVQVSGDAYTVSMRMLGISADRIKVCVTDERAIVSAQSSSSQENAAQGSDGFVEELRSLYYVVRWPELIDPETCNAKFENGKLTLSARKALREAGGTSEDSAARDTRSAAPRGGAS
jgi:HSP20 family molecular chaperone IbpA